MFGKARNAPPLGDEARELFELLRRYAIQETWVPIKSLGRSLAFGAVGALLAGTGFVFVLIGLLRLLETETGTTFGGNWSFVPYLLTMLAGLVVIGLCVFIGTKSARGEGEQTAR